jgi:hypothetical protein
MIEEELSNLLKDSKDDIIEKAEKFDDDPFLNNEKIEKLR